MLWLGFSYIFFFFAVPFSLSLVHHEVSFSFPLLPDLFHSGVLSSFFFLFLYNHLFFSLSTHHCVVLDGFSLITLLPLCLGGSQAVLRCGVKACAKLALRLCPKKRWWGLGVFSIVIPALYVPHMTTSLTNQITA